jgi:hypothetical protein
MARYYDRLQGRQLIAAIWIVQVSRPALSRRMFSKRNCTVSMDKAIDPDLQDVLQENDTLLRDFVGRLALIRRM